MTTEQTKKILGALEEAWNNGNMDAVDELMDANYVGHSARGDVRGRERVKQRIAATRAAFPDLHTDTDDVMTDGDKIIVRWTLTGTHKGDYNGIAPTGKKVRSTGISIYRIADGKMVERWEETDSLGFMQQLGVIPMPGQPRG